MDRVNTAVIAATSFCSFALGGCVPDSVGPSYDYGSPNPDQSGGAGGTANPGGSGGSSGVAPAGGSAGSSGGAAGTAAAAGTAGSGGMTAGTPLDPKCDLNGRWAITQRFVIEALGVMQAMRAWFYYEIHQQGETVTVTKGLHCGYDIVPISPLGASVDLRKAWPKIMTENPQAGRAVSIKVTSAGCDVTFGKIYSIDGMTASFYRDPAQPLPGPEQKATATTPGWEDWDGDDKPGVSYHTSGLVNGKLFVAGRNSSTWAGSIANTTKGFIVPNTGTMEEGLLGYDGPALLTSTGVRARDPALHFVEFGRLDPAQAVGDDAATCSAVRALANTLTPKANEKPVQ